MAAHARRLCAQNGVDHIVTVLEGYMEKQTLPEKVDIIISEWMGYFLLRESMFDSVIIARDQYLKPGGALYPSHAKMYWCPVALQDDRDAKLAETADTLAEWDAFDLNTITLDEAQGVVDAPFAFDLPL